MCVCMQVLNEGLKVIKAKAKDTAVLVVGVDGDAAVALANVPKDKSAKLSAVDWVKAAYSPFGDASAVRGAPVVAQMVIAGADADKVRPTRAKSGPLVLNPHPRPLFVRQVAEAVKLSTAVAAAYQ